MVLFLTKYKKRLSFPKTMLLGVQFIGIFFGLLMIYFSYVYYRRNSYSWKSYLLWCLIWIGFIFLVIFPQTVYGVMQVLEIRRTADFFVMAGLLLFASILFYLYAIVKTTEKKMQQLTRAFAIEVKKSRDKKR